jgi:seryl-tRNA(Sec) selenium transferase
MNRREILKGLSIIPFAGGFLPPDLDAVAAAPRGPLAAGPNIFQSIGVEPVINCVGTFTIIGGSLERPEVSAASHAAAQHFVQYDELAYGVGQRLADLTKAEWGVVSSGCAGAENIFTLACLTGGNPEKLLRIPDLSGFERTEVIIPVSSRNASDHAIRITGVKIINVNNTEELIRSMSPRTAMIYVFAGYPDLTQIAEKAKEFNIPILVDAAAEDLTIPNVHLQLGATAVCYSGGKAICGPQCAGLLLGRKDILQSAWQSGSPHWGPGRTQKVGKEEIIGMLAAVEAWIARDHDEKRKTWHSYLDTIAKRVSTINGVTCKVKEPKGLGNASPSLNISWDPEKFHISGRDVAEELGTQQPRIAIHSAYRDENARASGMGSTSVAKGGAGTTSVTVSSGQMQPGNDKLVADRIYDVLSKKRSKPGELTAPAANIVGRWDVDVEYYSSKSQHTFYIENQDSNWLRGSHKRDFCTREMVGILEGDQIKLSSDDRQIADSLPYIFAGTVSGDTMSGKIVMFGYLNAKFKATRFKKEATPVEIVVPKGEPLAT